MNFLRLSSAPFVLIGLVAGCASVPLASPQADAAAKKFEPPPGHANLYVYRNEHFGAAARLSVNLDGAALGDTAAKTYLYTPIAPGRHTLVSKAENDSDAVIDAEPGKNYFIWQEVKMGLWSARTLLQAVNEQTGRSGVLECALSSTRPAPQQTACAKDTDCKGERICEQRQCVAPTQGRPAM